MAALKMLGICGVLLVAGCGQSARAPGSTRPAEADAIIDARTMLDANSVSINAVTTLPSTDEEQQ